MQASRLAARAKGVSMIHSVVSAELNWARWLTQCARTETPNKLLQATRETRAPEQCRYVSLNRI